MIHCSLLCTAAILRAVQMKRKSCYCLCQKPDAGVDRRNLHGALFIHPLAGIRPSKYKGLPGVTNVIFYIRELGFVSRADPQPF